MLAYCCNHCNKIIDEQDIEAIEVETPYQRRLFSNENFVQTVQEKVHYCGECKITWHTEWV